MPQDNSINNSIYTEWINNNSYVFKHKDNTLHKLLYKRVTCIYSITLAFLKNNAFGLNNVFSSK